MEFSNLPDDAQYTANAIANGVNTPSGPTTVEQTSGTHSYAGFTQNIAGSYPVTFEFRLDTIINGVVVYQSSLVVTCSADLSSTPLVSPVNTDTGSPGNQYRRWLDDGKTYTCTDTGTAIAITISNQDVEFNNLPEDAQYTINNIANGVNTPSGP